MQEGVDQHIQNFYKEHGSQAAQFINIDFKKPMRPGEIYTVLLPPAEMEPNPVPGVVDLVTMPLLLHMEAMPRVKTDVDHVAGKASVEIEIPTVGKVDPADALHATAAVQVRLVQDARESGKTENEAALQTEQD